VGTDPVLLFCHVGMWSFIWRDVIARLQTGYRCVTLDVPGSGLSDRVPADHQTLATARDAVGAVIDHLDLRSVTLVLHDLGGVAGLAAGATRAGRIRGLVAANTFGWRPGPLLRGMLAWFGSSWMRGLDAATAWLPAASTTRLGVGRHLDRPSRRAFRRGMDRAGRGTMHRLFASAGHSDDVYRQADLALTDRLADRPVLTVFGALGDYLRFRPRWRRQFPPSTRQPCPGSARSHVRRPRADRRRHRHLASDPRRAALRRRVSRSIYHVQDVAGAAGSVARVTHCDVRRSMTAIE
jgi:haloalkane dehalogenase